MNEVEGREKMKTKPSKLESQELLRRRMRRGTQQGRVKRRNEMWGRGKMKKQKR